MSDRLPDFAEPFSLCRRGGVVEGQVPLVRMGRLTSLGVAPEGDARGRLAFGRDASGRPVVDVSVAATLRLTCQRCLGEVELAVAENRRLALVESEAEAERLPGDLEPLLVGPAPLRPADVLEEELMLALPIVAVHPEGACGLPRVPDEPGDDPDGARRRPFADLDALKGGRS